MRVQTLEEGLVDDAPVGLGNDHAGRTECCGGKLRDHKGSIRNAQRERN